MSQGKNERSSPSEKTQLDRIEQKLDLIIEFFSIGKAPCRSKRQLEEVAKQSVRNFTERQEKRKGRQRAKETTKQEV